MPIDMDKENGLVYPKRAVVDTNVILNIAIGEKDNLPEDCLERSKKLIDDAIAGKFELMLPSICLIELSSDHLIRAQGNPIPQDFKKMKRQVVEWCDNSDLPFVDLTMGAALWYHDTPSIQCVRPMDAAILAAARFANATTVYTWDDKFIKFVEQANAVETLGVTAENPPKRPITLQLD